MSANSNWSRRKALKTFGIGLVGFMVPANFNTLKGSKGLSFKEIWEPVTTPARPVTAITLGAGARGNTYGNFGISFPEMLNIVGVAEPIPIRRERYARRHEILAGNVFTTWEHVFERPKFADAIIISTPDDLHYAPCMRALEMGYDILLEKPIAPTEQECRDILEKANRTARVVAVCHVLRYAPYFQKMHALLQTDVMGKIVSMQHFEPIQHVHMAHSYVRGNWHNAKETTPIILAKSCHDLDMMRWLIGKPSEQIAAFGNLTWFRRENAPSGSTARCTDGCRVEPECPYSALHIYHRKREWTYVFDLPDDRNKHGDAIMEYLKTTNYGRCVYRMENDQPDHYVCAMTFDGGITASFNMEAFTSYHGRQTRIMGSMGDIRGDMREFILTDFMTRESTTFDNTAGENDPFGASGHGGGDWRLMYDWVKAVAKQDPSMLTSTIDASIESHLMGFAAEKSRLGGTIEAIRI